MQRHRAQWRHRSAGGAGGGHGAKSANHPQPDNRGMAVFDRRGWQMQTSEEGMVEFTQDLFDRMCDRIAGGESMRSVCRDNECPSKQTFLKWVANDPALAAQYARARDAQTEALVDELIDIADDRSGDVDDEGNVDHDAIARAKLRIDTRKWIASKMLPKKYGDKLAIGGADDLGPVRVVTAVELSDDDLARIAAGEG